MVNTLVLLVIFFEEFQNLFYFYYVLFGLADGIDGGEVYVFTEAGLAFEVFVHQFDDMVLHALKEQKGTVVTAELTAVHSFPGSDGLAYHKCGDAEVATRFAEVVGQLHYAADDVETEDFQFVVDVLAEVVEHLYYYILPVLGEFLEEEGVETVVGVHQASVVLALFPSKIDF